MRAEMEIVLDSALSSALISTKMDSMEEGGNRLLHTYQRIMLFLIRIHTLNGFWS